MKNKEDIIRIDFQGWPEYKITLKELLEKLGAKEKDGMFGFEKDDKLLDIYPTTLIDDGMGYGVHECFFIDAVNDKNESVVLWRESKDPDLKQEDL